VSLISRYVLRETVGAWSVVLAVLLLILMSNQFAELLGEAAADRLPRDALLAIFSLTSLSYLMLIAPISLFLGIMLALARLSRDSEMAALGACGVGPTSLLKPIFALAVVLAAGVGWLALVQTPHAAAQIEQLRAQAREVVGLGVIEPERFISPDAGDTVLYAGAVVGGEIRDVFLQRQQNERVVVILADRVQQVYDRASGRQTFVFRDGRRYEGVPGGNEFLIVEFAEHGIPVADRPEEAVEESPMMRPTVALLGSDDPADRAELQWRVSAPLSLMILAVLAVPLSRSSPREGRYGRLGVGLLIYVIYANAMTISRVWVEREQLPAWLGMWWEHIALAVLALWLLGREAGWFAGWRAPAREEKGAEEKGAEGKGA
jgi:lipopolysaccharide export system permease protein